MQRGRSSVKKEKKNRDTEKGREKRRGGKKGNRETGVLRNVEARQVAGGWLMPGVASWDEAKDQERVCTQACLRTRENELDNARLSRRQYAHTTSSFN